MFVRMYKVCDNFQRTEGCKIISPHHYHPTNGVRPSDSMGSDPRILTAHSLLRNKCLLVRQILAFLLNVAKMG